MCVSLPSFLPELQVILSALAGQQLTEMSKAPSTATWIQLRRTLELFSCLQRAQPAEWRWRVLVNRWHPMTGDAALLALLMQLNELVKAHMSAARGREEEEREKESSNKPDTSLKKELKVLGVVAALLKTLYGDEARTTKND